MARNEIFFNFCNASRGDILNIYIHGYSAVTSDAEEKELKKKVPLRASNTTNAFMFWPAGNAKDIDYKKLAGYATLNIAGAVGATVGITRDAISNYLYTERSIPQLVYQFIYKLSKFINEEKVEYKELNFFGHSLGARMIIEAILELPNDFKPLKIKNIIFMGGARSLNENECQRILDSISGSIFNIYSNGDRVLQFIKPDLEKCIGRYPIMAQSESLDRVKNHAFHWLGHMDYWDNLNGIINYLNLDQASTHSLIPLGPQGSQVVNPFAVQDVGLYLPLCHATAQEKKVLAGILCQRKSAAIQKDETNAVALTNELQLMGGDSIANKARGHGVCYREILDDAAEKLGIPQRENLGFISLEEAIYAKIVSLIREKLETASEKEKIDYLKILAKTGEIPQGALHYSALSLSALLSISSLIAGRIAAGFIPVVGQLVGAVSLFGSGVTYFSGPAFSVTIPSIMVIHHIRKRVSQEVGEGFLFND
ncbi:DUF726 domain-containing protein [Pectobacterium polonicum]|uniref:DUF726 domain-containing protein n=1 Tax=Pectobacterium polonicum TaxID=2485124 RepID=A0AAE9SWF2_9GAMM|nr:DUF726 domain-containing protein [Pectobacterium polonicum]UVO07463.1 DUF726 domain-containing protein [Pectobacterium polonicum]